MFFNQARTIALAAAFLAPLAAATPLPSTSSSRALTPRSNTGEATFYGGNLSGGMCSFTGYTLPSGVYGTALASENWSTAANCGACVKVTGPKGNTLTAMVVDQCPGCGTNHLDLFQDAFAQLSDISAGVIDVSWEYVKCGISAPLTLKNKEGTSAYWFSMQAMGANERVASLQVSTDGGSTWQATERKEYNFFEKSSGFGTDTVAVKVTGVSGKEIVTKNVKVSSGATQKAGSNF